MSDPSWFRLQSLFDAAITLAPSERESHLTSECGLSYDEVAEALDISPATVHRDLRMARAWLRTRLDPTGA